MRRRNYTKDMQVRTRNTTLGRAHQQWIKYGKSKEVKFALTEVAKARTVVRQEARGKSIGKVS